MNNDVLYICNDTFKSNTGQILNASSISPS